MTGQEMCEYIAAVARARSGVEIESEAIWNASPSGELWPVVAAYQTAREWAENGHYETDFDGSQTGEPGRMTFVQDGPPRFEVSTA